MALIGYIRLFRKIKEHWLFRDKRRFSKFEAFIDLIFLCNHKCAKVLIGNALVLVKRGQFISSNVKLGETWRWSEGAVRIFLKLLEQEGMVRVKSTRKYTLYEVTNYYEYQSVDTNRFEGYQLRTEYEQITSRIRAEYEQNTTNNNDNNVNNVNNVKNEKELKKENKKRKVELNFTQAIEQYTTDEEIQKTINEFITYRSVKNKPFRTENAFNLFLKKLDKYPEHERKEVIEQSIMNDYTGIFPLKNSNSDKNKKDAHSLIDEIGREEGAW